MKEYLTMKEAGLLLGKTTKTIKNYIKRGVIKNYFQVDGKYGQEYKISVRDLEPLGIAYLDVLRDDFSAEERNGRRGRLPGEISGELDGNIPGKTPLTEQPPQGPAFDPATFISRYEELVLEVGRLQERAAGLAEENARLKQEIGEKNMLISVLMKKKDQPESD